MKKIILVLTAFFFLCIVLVSTSYADPWLTCDAYPPGEASAIDRMDVDLNGQLINVETATMRKEAGVWYLLDLSSIAAGSYTAKAKAISTLWSVESDWSTPLLFVKPALEPPANVNIKF